jgi:hypothetical protein
MSMWFFLDSNGKQVGPKSERDLAVLYGSSVSETTRIWSKSLGEWKKLKDVPELFVKVSKGGGLETSR